MQTLEGTASRAPDGCRADDLEMDISNLGIGARELSPDRFPSVSLGALARLRCEEVPVTRQGFAHAASDFSR